MLRSRESGFLVTASLIVCLGTMVGCGPAEPEMGLVSGTVLQDGKPVPNASVTFFPISGRPSYGTSDGSGKYSLEYGMNQMGASLGMSKVKIVTGGPGMPQQVEESDPSKRTGGPAVSMPAGPAEVLLPEAVEVVSGENTIDLVLP